MPTDPDTDLRNAKNLLEHGQLDEAVRTYVQLADDYWLEEKYAEADAIYRRVLETEHNHDHALWQLSDIAVRCGRADEARQFLSHLIDLRTLRGDEDGIAACQQRLRTVEASSSVQAPGSPPVVEVDLSDALADIGDDL